MRARSNTLFPLLLLVALALLSFWLERAVRQTASNEVRPKRHDPDFIIENFTATNLNQHGQPTSTLTARRMQHFPDDETSELESPRLVHLHGDALPVRISADRGLVAGTGEEVQLFGSVVVLREATAERPELRMETSFLQVFPEQDRAQTPERVVITQGQSRLSGVGMEVNSRTQEFHLKSRVTGTFVGKDS